MNFQEIINNNILNLSKEKESEIKDNIKLAYHWVQNIKIIIKKDLKKKIQQIILRKKKKMRQK